MSFAITAAATVASAAIGAYSSNKAAKSQQAATNTAIGEQQRQYDQTREDFAPYRETGVNALRQLSGDIIKPLTSAEVMSEPGYQFGMQQGQQAIDRRIAASGGRVSGQAIKAAGRYGTDYATVGYGAAYQRRQDRLNRLAALAGIGQTSTGASAAAGQGSSNAISGLVSSQGDARGASQLSQGATWQNAGNQLAAMYGRSTPAPSYGGFRYDDPYRNPMYFGGDSGE
jgi:hypothetical protein